MRSLATAYDTPDGAARKERSGAPPTPPRARSAQPAWLKRLLYCHACRAIYEGNGIDLLRCEGTGSGNGSGAIEPALLHPNGRSDHPRRVT